MLCKFKHAHPARPTGPFKLENPLCAAESPGTSELRSESWIVDITWGFDITSFSAQVDQILMFCRNCRIILAVPI